MMRPDLLAYALCLPIFGQVLASGSLELKPKMLAWAERARSLKPKKAEVLADCGRAYLAAGDKPQAAAAFDSAVASDRKNEEVRKSIVESWLKFGEKDLAMSMIREAIASLPGEDEMITAFACNLMDAGLIQEAETTMRLALAASADEWRNFVAYGRACLRAQRREEAAEWFERAANAKPKDADVWRLIALAYADRGADSEEIR